MNYLQFITYNLLSLEVSSQQNFAIQQSDNKRDVDIGCTKYKGTKVGGWVGRAVLTNPGLIGLKKKTFSSSTLFMLRCLS